MGSGSSKSEKKTEAVGLLSVVFDHSSSLSFVVVGGVIILGMVTCYTVTKLFRARRLRISSARRAQDVELELYRRDRAKRGSSSRFSSFRRTRQNRRGREQHQDPPPYPTLQHPTEGLVLGTLSKDGLRLVTRPQSMAKTQFDSERFTEISDDDNKSNAATAAATTQPTTDIAQQLLAAAQQ